MNSFFQGKQNNFRIAFVILSSFLDYLSYNSFEANCEHLLSKPLILKRFEKILNIRSFTLFFSKKSQMNKTNLEPKSCIKLRSGVRLRCQKVAELWQGLILKVNMLGNLKKSCLAILWWGCLIFSIPVLVLFIRQGIINI